MNKINFCHSVNRMLTEWSGKVTEWQSYVIQSLFSLLNGRDASCGILFEGHDDLLDMNFTFIIFLPVSLYLVLPILTRLISEAPQFFHSVYVPRQELKACILPSHL